MGYFYQFVSPIYVYWIILVHKNYFYYSCSITKRYYYISFMKIMNDNFYIVIHSFIVSKINNGEIYRDKKKLYSYRWVKKVNKKKSWT